MKRIGSQTQLIEKHAAQGDPSAFFTIFGAELRDIYTLMRTKGVPHKQTVSTVVLFARNCYRKYVRSKPKMPPCAWMQRRRKALPEARPSGDTDEVYIGNIDSRGIEDFEHAVQLTLQREYGAMRGSRGGGAPGHSLGPVLAGRPVRVLALVVLFAAALFGLEFLLRALDCGVGVTVTLPRHILSFSFPLAGHKALSAPSEASAARQADSSTHASTDTVSGKETGGGGQNRTRGVESKAPSLPQSGAGRVSLSGASTSALSGAPRAMPPPKPVAYRRSAPQETTPAAASPVPSPAPPTPPAASENIQGRATFSPGLPSAPSLPQSAPQGAQTAVKPNPPSRRDTAAASIPPPPEATPQPRPPDSDEQNSDEGLSH